MATATKKHHGPKIHRFNSYGNKVERIMLSNLGLLTKYHDKIAFEQSCLKRTKLKRLPDLEGLWKEFCNVKDDRKSQDTWFKNLSTRNLIQEYNGKKKINTLKKDIVTKKSNSTTSIKLDSSSRPEGAD